MRDTSGHDRAERGPISLELYNASLHYRGRPLFAGLDLSLEPGGWTVLLGPSGIGKSSLLRMLAGLTPAEPGTRIASNCGGSPFEHVAYMAQQDMLMPWLDLMGNVTLGYRLRGTLDLAVRARARALIEAVGLAGHAQRFPRELSVGMRQRTALARTLLEDRPIVLMDEPFSALDVPTRARLQDLAARLLAGRTVLLVTHDPLEALRLGDRIQILAGGPARLSTPIRPAGPPPRPATDPSLLALQAQLIGALEEGGEAA
jgi:putative hydroxymethylpyrimidine transport system ATP-binding protein